MAERFQGGLNVGGIGRPPAPHDVAIGPHQVHRAVRGVIALARLATEDAAANSLLNPRQSTPVEYVNSPLNLPAQDAAFMAGARAGMPAPEARLRAGAGDLHLTSCFGAGFVLLYFAPHPGLPAAMASLATPGVDSPATVKVICIASQGEPDAHTLIDELGQAHERYDATKGTVYLVRPDGYVMGRWRTVEATDIQAALKPFNHL